LSGGERTYDHYLIEAYLDPDTPSEGFPYDLPAVQAIRQQPLAFHPKVTYLTGENGTGKSTLLEAVAEAMGFNPEGGTRNLHFSTRDSHSSLSEYVHVARGRTAHRGFFLRAESFYNVASTIDDIGVTDYYGGRSLHDQSHGESFLALAANQFGGDGVFFLDEPEAALSPGRQLTILAILHRSISAGSQYVIATHSPILMAYPDSWIYRLDESGLDKIAYDDAEAVQITRNFLASPERMLRHLFAD